VYFAIILNLPRSELPSTAKVGAEEAGPVVKHEGQGSFGVRRRQLGGGEERRNSQTKKCTKTPAIHFWKTHQNRILAKK